MGQLDKLLGVKSHRVINGLAKLISNKIAESVPGITLDYVGKQESGNIIRGSVVGTVIVPDGEVVKTKVNEALSDVKSQIALKSMRG